MVTMKIQSLITSSVYDQTMNRQTLFSSGVGNKVRCTGHMKLNFVVKAETNKIM